MTTRFRALASVPWLVACFLLVPSLALAGPNAGGTLILHANPSIVFTSDTQNYCGMAALDSCSAAVTSVEWDPGKHVVFHAIAAFPPGSQPRLKGLSFGIDHDPTKFVMAARGTCADFEIPDGLWPAPGTGTAQSWTTGTQTGLLTEVYWFVGYAYSEQEGEDSTSVALIPHPLHYGVFVDDAFPAEVDTIAGYGRLGFGMAGYLPCTPRIAPGGEVGEPPDHPGGGDGVLTGVDIHPHTIYRSGGTWAFLVTGLDRLDLDSANLMAGQVSVLPSDYREVGPGRVLCFYDYPDVPRGMIPEVTVRSRGGQSASFRLEVKDVKHPSREEMNPDVGTRLRPGTIDWTPVPRSGPFRAVERSLQEVTVRDSLLALILSGFRVAGVSKGHQYLADSDSVLNNRRGNYAIVHPEERSLYSFIFPSGIPNTVAAEAILECPSVLDAWARHVVIAPRSDCDSGIQDPYYPNQWELQGMAEHPGSRGVQANSAWCTSKGLESCLFLIDAPLNYEHPDIHPQLLPDVPPQPAPLPGPDAYHGMECAVLAVGAINNVGMVGAAPEAFLYPYEWRYGDPFFSPVSKLSLYLDDIYYRAWPDTDVVSMSWHMDGLSPQDQQYIEGLLQRLYDYGVPLFAARDSMSDFPASYPAVCAVQGIKRYATQGTCATDASAVRAPCSDFSMLPTWYDPWWAAPPPNYFGSSYATAITAGVSMLIMHCSGPWSPSTLYGELANETATYGRVIASIPCAAVGINDIANFEVSSSSGCRVNVDYDIVDVYGIVEIRVFVSPSCWGPFELCYSFQPSGDGHYQHSIDRLCSGTQYVQMRVYDSTGNYAFYQGAAAAGSGCSACTQPSPPTYFEASVDGTTAKLQWSSLEGPGNSEYYIVGGAAEDLSECGWGGRWGSWSRAELPFGGQGCACETREEEPCQCWNDQGLAPGAAFSYRLAVVYHATGGRILKMSDFTPERTVHVSSTASAPDATSGPGTDAALWPNPLSTRQDLLIELEAKSPGSVTIEVYDASGRLVSSPMDSYEVRVGMNSLRLPAATMRRALRTPGVYFASVALPGGRRIPRKVVVLP
jgi:hypothetical protein